MAVKCVLMQECFPKLSRMGTARTKFDKESEEAKNRGVGMEISTAGTKEKKVRRAKN